MLEEVLGSLHNWFVRSIAAGSYTIKDGELAAQGLPVQDGQYIRIVGSVFNDGLHQWPVTGLKDEEFTGEIWLLAVPKAVEDLASAIEVWQQRNGDAVMSPYTSESFGGYSYTKAGSTDEGGSGTATWQDVYGKQLRRWRKVPGCW